MEAAAKAGEAEAEAEAEAGFHSRVVISASMITRHEHDLNDVDDCRRGICLKTFRWFVGWLLAVCWLSWTWFVTNDSLLLRFLLRKKNKSTIKNSHKHDFETLRPEIEKAGDDIWRFRALLPIESTKSSRPKMVLQGKIRCDDAHFRNCNRDKIYVTCNYERGTS